MSDVATNQTLTKGLWNQMVANLNDLDARVTASSATPAFGMAYRTSVFDLTATNTWTNLPFNADGNLLGISHDNVTNSERLTVAAAGTYSVEYTVRFRRQGAAHHGLGRVMKNGVTEVPASFSIGSPNTGDVNEDAPLHAKALVSLAAGEYVSVQIATNTNVTNEVDVFTQAGMLPDPVTRTYANFIIEKV